MGPLCNILGPDCPAAGVSTYRSRILPSVNACPGRGVTPGAYAWHQPTLHYYHTHVLGAHASFHVIPTLRWCSFGETLDRGLRIVYPYSYLRTRVARWTFLFVLVCLVHVYMESWRRERRDFCASVGSNANVYTKGPSQATGYVNPCTCRLPSRWIRPAFDEQGLLFSDHRYGLFSSFFQVPTHARHAT